MKNSRISIHFSIFWILLYFYWILQWFWHASKLHLSCANAEKRCPNHYKTSLWPFWIFLDFFGFFDWQKRCPNHYKKASYQLSLFYFVKFHGIFIFSFKNLYFTREMANRKSKLVGRTKPLQAG